MHLGAWWLGRGRGGSRPTVPRWVLAGVALLAGLTGMAGLTGVSAAAPATTNGGWSVVLHLPKDTRPYDISCPSPQTCVLTAERVYKYAANEAEIFRTTDGGKVWKQAANLPSFGTNFGLAVACSGVSQCEVAGYQNTSYTSVLIGTSNGTTWKLQANPKDENFSSIACPAKLVCEAVGDNNSSLRTTTPIARTTDGGNVWHRQSYSRDVSTVSCPTVDVCVAGGPEAGVIYTHDGGAKWWPSRKANCSWDVQPTQVACGSPTNCVAFGNQGRYGGRNLLMTTTDGGVNWTRRTVPKAVTQYSLLRSVACATATYCVATGSDGANVVTSNGGRTWRVQSRVSGVKGGLDKIACPTTSLCYALGNTVIFRRSS
jgi:photosystem II stability/assembly factor-like uncharacterized protein